MGYVIASARVGVIGEPFDVEAAAEAGVNVPALIQSGAIVESAPKKKKTED